MNTTKEIFHPQTTDEIAEGFSVFQELRIKLKDRQAFVDQVQRQMKEGYIFCYLLEENEAVACMGYRIFETFGWGKLLYIDDLITREKSRKRGFAKVLLDYAIEQARQENCAEVHLDSGHHRHDARYLLFKMRCARPRRTGK